MRHRNACEQALHRAVASEQILRVATGIYKITPPRPKPPPEPPRVCSDGTTDEQWPSWLFERRETGVWRGPGPPPGDPGRMVPMDIIWKFSARMGQREKELPSGRYFGARDAASRPSDARVRHMRQRLI